MSCYEPPWRNTWGPYNQVCRIDELDDWKLKELLKKYGQAFDDEWWYYVLRGGRGKGIYAKRVPIWLRNKRVPMEKARSPLLRGQTTLE